MRDELLTIHAVAGWLRVNQQTVRNWVDRGEMHAVRVGRRRVRVRQSEVERFIGAGDQPQTSVMEAKGEFRTAMVVAAGKLDATNEDLAGALVGLADAAHALARALEQTSPGSDESPDGEAEEVPVDVEDRR